MVYLAITILSYNYRCYIRPFINCFSENHPPYSSHNSEQKNFLADRCQILTTGPIFENRTFLDSSQKGGNIQLNVFALIHIPFMQLVFRSQIWGKYFSEGSDT